MTIKGYGVINPPESLEATIQRFAFFFALTHGSYNENYSRFLPDASFMKPGDRYYPYFTMKLDDFIKELYHSDAESSDSDISDKEDNEPEHADEVDDDDDDGEDDDDEVMMSDDEIDGSFDSYSRGNPFYDGDDDSSDDSNDDI